MASSIRVAGLLADLRRAARPGGRAALGLCTLEGTRIHERAVRAGARVERCLVGRSYAAPGRRRERDLVEALRARGCEILDAADDLLAAETEGRGQGAILGLARIPQPPPLAGLPRDPTSREVLLVAVEVEDPGNVGALVRTALAAGAAGIVSVGISDPYHPRAIRTSMGSLFRLPIYRYESFDALMADLGRSGTRPVAAVSHGGTPLPDFRPAPGRLALLVGREAFGLPEAVLQAAPCRVSIPMASAVDSYSVHAAAAILLHALIGGARELADGGNS